MRYPDFFNDVPRITLYDPLAEFLGAADEGVFEYSYLDAVRLAGHSCPTVASAYWATCLALASLYPGATPVRGDIRVEFDQESSSGVIGVMANVASMLTGAMAESGFKGIGGRFVRREKLLFAVEMPGEMRFTRLDTKQAVQVKINLQRVPASPRLPRLMSNCLANTASPEEVAEFRQLWQARVRSLLLEHGDDSEVFVVTPV
jgi:hypothetical protein